MKLARMLFATLVLAFAATACSGNPTGPDTAGEALPTIGAGVG